MKQVELTEYEFEYRRMSRLKALSGISGPSGMHCSEETQRFPLKYSSKSRELWIETWKKEIKLVVLEKH